jgi:polyisoprenyl-phosphate glycosyltransferase
MRNSLIFREVFAFTTLENLSFRKVLSRTDDRTMIGKLVKKKDLSVVIPVFNSSSMLESVVKELEGFLRTTGLKFEIILVNDCSADASLEIMRRLASKYGNCTNINLLLRQGQHRAVLAGLNHIKGEYVVVMDDDGQNPPSEIVKLYKAAREGHDLVFGNYIDYKQKYFRRLASSLMKSFVRFIFSSSSDISVSNFKIMHYRVVNLICKFAKSSPYINGEALLYASNPKSILVNHRVSVIIKSRYKLRSLLSLFKDILFTYSLRPLRLLTLITFSVSITSMVASLFVLASQYSNDNKVQGWTSLLLAVTFLSTLTILSIALISEYVIKALESNSNKSVLDFIEESTI